MQELIVFLSNHPALSSAIAVIFVILVFVELMRAKRNSVSLSPAKATQLINHDNAVLIDIRATEQYKSGHIIDAISLSAEELRQNGKKIEKFKNKPLIIVCNSGVESQKIAALLIKHGYNAYSLSGGMRAWSAAEMPLVKE